MKKVDFKLSTFAVVPVQPQTCSVSQFCAKSSSLGHWRRQGEGLRGPAPPPIAGQKRIFFVKIEGLLEPVILNLSIRVRSNGMFTSERRC